MGTSDEIGVLKSKFEAEVEKIRQLEKERYNCMSSRRQLESQLTENNMVKEELDRLEADAKVFKLIGPVLVKQDLAEARQNVEKRITYIRTEIDRMEYLLGDSAKRIETEKDSMEKIRDKLKLALGTAGGPSRPAIGE